MEGKVKKAISIALLVCVALTGLAAQPALAAGDEAPVMDFEGYDHGGIVWDFTDYEGGASVMDFTDYEYTSGIWDWSFDTDESGDNTLDFKGDTPSTPLDV
ncbi:hypothetical protein [Methanosarcina sp.]|uniref:hypothetical protein n=1 Tax=Methanosarcina sp. TaxID=2213 RepID=UPI003C750266